MAHIIPASIDGTDLISCEIPGQEEDVVINREEAEYLHWKLALLLDLPCEDDALKRITS